MEIITPKDNRVVAVTPVDLTPRLTPQDIEKLLNDGENAAKEEELSDTVEGGKSDVSGVGV